MLDRVQPGARREHPPGEDALDLALQRHLVDLEERIGVRRLGRRARVAGARRDLQRAELHRLADGGVEADDAAGDLVEAGEQRALVGDLLRWRLGDDLIAVGGLRHDARLALARRKRRIDRRGGTVGRRQGLRLHRARRRALPRLGRIGLLRRLCLGITRTGIALVWILRIAWRRLRHRLAAAGHTRGRPGRRPEQGFERIEELRRRGNRAERGCCRDRGGDQAGDAKQSSHQARSSVRHAWGSLVG